ncbi:hypothetical protein [Streptomyces sp. NRRL F-5123]|uniref:hypothetical protein n=1 Tax=Streptomyces sp. NRRL F-5123 TaxID=1463856 RepID=UPI000ABEC141|nr:hypothetical protein [Streptomyces sp. NRRL F-5123]
MMSLTRVLVIFPTAAAITVWLEPVRLLTSRKISWKFRAAQACCMASLCNSASGIVSG